MGWAKREDEGGDECRPVSVTPIGVSNSKTGGAGVLTFRPGVCKPLRCCSKRVCILFLSIISLNKKNTIFMFRDGGAGCLDWRQARLRACRMCHALK